MAAILPITVETLVNTNSLSGQQTDPLVTVLADGRYVIVWRDEAQVRFFAQFYSAAGVAQGAPVVVSTSSGVSLSGEAIVPLPNGGFAFAFQSGTGNFGIFARFVNADGTFGQLTQGSTSSAGLVPGAHIQLHALSSTQVVAMWDLPNSSPIRSNTVTDNGVIGTETRIDTLSGQHVTPTVANYAGGYVVAWNSAAGIYLRRYASNGAATDATEQLISANPGASFAPLVVSLTNGGYAVIWADGTNTGTSTAPVYHETYKALFFDASGAAVGTAATLFQFDSSVAGESLSNWSAIGTSDGGFLLSTTTERQPGIDPNVTNVFELTLRTFSDHGQATSNPQVIDSANLGAGEVIQAERGNVQATRLGDGSIIFSWGFSSSSDTGDVLMRRYSYNVPTSANGTPGNDNVVADGSGTLLNLSQGGNDTATGTAANEGFYFGAAFNTADIIDAGGGTDQLGLQGDYSGANALVFGADQLVSVEQIVLLSGNDPRFGGGGAGYSYNLTLNDANVAAGASFAVSANQLAANETLTLNASAETNAAISVFGGAGNDVLILGALGDTVFGGGGNDVITGRGGADQLTGGAGNDIFVYQAVGDSIVAARDHIFDFATGDRIDVTGFDANSVAGGVQPFTFIGTGQFTGVAGQLRAFNIDGFDWYVNGDTNGDRIADFSVLVTVPDGHALTIADFNGAVPQAAIVEIDVSGEFLARSAFTLTDLPLDAQAAHAMIG